MAMQQGIGFRACGVCVRKFVPASGKCAFLTLEIPGARRTEKHEFRTFAEDVIVEVGSLAVGAVVEVTGNIQTEVLKDKAKNDIQVDGRACWVERLTIKAIKVEGASKRPEPRPTAQETFGDDDMPF